MNINRQIIEKNFDDIVKYYLETKSMKLVCVKYNLSLSTLYRVFKEKNVDTTIDRKKAGERIRKYELDQNYFGNIDTRDKSYITGILHSDGCITKTGQVRIKMTDLDLMEQINSKIYKNRKLYIHTPEDITHKQNKLLVITHEQIYNDVQKHGCCLDKSYNLQFPTTIPEYLMGDYFRGFFDGDGCIYVNEKLSYKPANITILATNDWVNDAIKWLGKKGIRGVNYQDKRHDERIGRLTLSDVKSVKIFFDLMYENLNGQIYLERKFEKYKKNIEFRKSLDNKIRNFDSDEIFKKIEGLENYEIGNKGSVKSMKNGDIFLLKPYEDKFGYLTVSVGKTKKFLVHKLVADAFLIKPDENGLIIIHDDENNSNNCVNNLKWVNRSNHIKKAFEKGKRKNIGEGCNFAKLNVENVLEIRKLSNAGVNMKPLSKKFNVSITAIFNIITGKTWKSVEGHNKK